VIYMINIIQQSAEDRAALFQYTANELNINEAIIEKDFWVCFMLEVLFEHSPYAQYFAFKGGTSLSKSFQLINRFSEDIDLILDWRTLGYGLKEPLEDRSNTKQDQFKKEITQRTIDFLANEFVPTINVILKDLLLVTDVFELSIDPIDPQTVLMAYPKNFDDASIVKQIRLEIGPLAAWTPVSNHRLHAYIYDVPGLDHLGKKEISVPTVEISRTFWEKATILHAEAHRPSEKSLPARYSRHYYDVYMIQRNVEILQQILIDKDLLVRVVDFKHRFYRLNWAQYDKAINNQLILIPENPVTLKGLGDDYESMKNMLFGEIPSFEEIIHSLKRLEQQINQQ
jgi:hypothetical protein